MPALPPNGWWIREQDERLSVYGWDWPAGITSLLHGIITLPLLLWLAGNPVATTAGWLLLSLLLGAGVGFRITVDRQGLSLSRTWMGLALWTRRLPDGTPVGEGHDPYAPEGADHVAFVSIGGQSVGNPSNARFIAKALRTAQARFENLEP